MAPIRGSTVSSARSCPAASQIWDAPRTTPLGMKGALQRPQSHPYSLSFDFAAHSVRTRWRVRSPANPSGLSRPHHHMLTGRNARVFGVHAREAASCRYSDTSERIRRSDNAPGCVHFPLIRYSASSEADKPRRARTHAGAQDSMHDDTIEQFWSRWYSI